MEAGQISNCKKNLEHLLVLQPHHLEGHYLNGWLHMVEKNFDSAIACFDTCLTNIQAEVISSKHVIMLALQCRSFCLASLNKSDAALKDINRLLPRELLAEVISVAANKIAIDPKMQLSIKSVAKTLALRGLMYMNRNELELALMDFKKSYDLDASELTLLYQAECFRLKGKFMEAVESFEGSIERLTAHLHESQVDDTKHSAGSKFRYQLEAPFELNQTDIAYIRNTIGLLMFSLGQYEAATNQISFAIQFQDMSVFHFNRSIMLYKMKSFRASIDELKIAAELDPNSLFVLNNLALMHEQFHDFTKSQEILISSYNTQFCSSYSMPKYNYNFDKTCYFFNVGNAFAKTKRYEESIKVYDLITKDDMILNRSLAVSLLNNKSIAECFMFQFDYALENLNEAFSIGFFSDTVRFNRGHVLIYLHNIEKALDDFEALEEHHDNQNITAMRGLCLRWMWGLKSACQEILFGFGSMPNISLFLENGRSFPLLPKNSFNCLAINEAHSFELSLIKRCTSVKSAYDTENNPVSNVIIKRFREKVESALSFFNSAFAQNNVEKSFAKSSVIVNEKFLELCNTELLQAIYCLQSMRWNSIHLDIPLENLLSVFFLRAILLARKGYFDAAIFDIKLLLDFQDYYGPNISCCWSLWHLLGVLHWKMKSFDFAYSSFKESVKLNPFSYLSYLNMAYLDYHFFRFSAAVKNYGSIVALITNCSALKNSNKVHQHGCVEYCSKYFSLNDEQWVFDSAQSLVFETLTSYISILSKPPPWNGIESIQGKLLMGVEQNKRNNAAIADRAAKSERDLADEMLSQALDKYLEIIEQSDSIFVLKNNAENQFEEAFAAFAR